MPINTSDNKFGVTKWIVDPTNGNGTHTTIQGAVTSASSGDTIFVRPGTYTEDVTLKAGITIASFAGDSNTPEVTVVGKFTATFAGTCSISNIYLKTNADNFLVISGSSNTVINLIGCYLLVDAGVIGISYTSSGASASLLISNCQGDVTHASGSFFSSTAVGTLKIYYCKFIHSGASVVTNNCTSSQFEMIHSFFSSPLKFTSPASAAIRHSNIHAIGEYNITTVTGGTVNIEHCFLQNTTGVITIGSGSTVKLTNSTISGPAASVVGAGSLSMAPVAWQAGTGQVVTTTTITDLPFGRSNTYTPVVTFGGSSTGVTFSSGPFGYYLLIGKMCYFTLQINLTNNGSGTGNFAVTLPFAATATTSTVRVMACVFGSATSLPAGSTYCTGSIGASGTTLGVDGFAIAGFIGSCTQAHITDTAGVAASGVYEIA